MSDPSSGPPPPSDPWQARGPLPGTPVPPTSPKAITSLVLGVVGLFLCGLFAGVPAIILGFLARRDVRQSGGALSGDGLALAGIIAGALATLWSLALGALVVGLFALSATVDGDLDDLCLEVSS